MAIKIYNTLTRKKEEFVPLHEGKVLMYSCGLTVYNYFHLGNARAFVVPDMVRRYLEYNGYEVKLVQNITDIDDKIINSANELEVPAETIAKKYTEAFLEDIAKLGIRPATVQPKATEHIPEIIALVQKLVEKGVAYEVDGDVYYSIRKFKDYGKLSKRGPEDMLAGARVEVDERKEYPADFALWKKSKPGEPAWDSPWGQGRPGWHIECSAMAMKHLAETIDIHAGGADLIFPHHENEIAQSEMATGKPFAKYWFHWAFVQVDGKRMGKSERNYFIIRDALEKFPPEAIRHYLLSAHYRSPLDYRATSLQESFRAIARLKNCLSNLDRLADDSADCLAPPRDLPRPLLQGGKMLAMTSFDPKDLSNPETSSLYESVGKTRENFEKAMDDDFNTAGALGAIYELVGETNRFLAANENRLSAEDRVVFAYVRDNIIELCDVLGMYTKEDHLSSDQGLVDGLMQLILEVRQNARSKKDWDTADKIRDGLKELDIELKDTHEGTVWTKKK